MSERLRTTIASLLGRLRAARRWTLRELADRSGLSIPYLSELERGRKVPTLEAMERLATAFEMTLAELLQALARSLNEAGGARGVCDFERGLTPEDRAELEQFAAYLRWRRAQRERGNSGRTDEP
ncbi:MAG: helix-turn-helix domain-containing protein [Thermomicrobium sp.]|nr:helix-turn-helix domain-containing protein [Thermomicrobium sp.]MDW7981871.1 helix-turn-helix transcriptional regulator [Thermomicrobium sp.]